MFRREKGSIRPDKDRMDGYGVARLGGLLDESFYPSFSGLRRAIGNIGREIGEKLGGIDRRVFGDPYHFH